jgi:hypothetical protein
MTTIEGSTQPQPLTEDRVREICVEVIDAWQADICRGLPGPSEQMRRIMQLAALPEGEVR